MFLHGDLFSGCEAKSMIWVCTLLVLCNLASQAGGDPCMDGTNTCNKETQRCEVKPNARDFFTCRCIKDYEVLTADNTCVDIPDRQRVYLRVPLCVPVSAKLSIPVDSLIADPGSASEELLLAYKNFTRHEFKTVQTHAFECNPTVGTSYDGICERVWVEINDRGKNMLKQIADVIQTIPTGSYRLEFDKTCYLVHTNVSIVFNNNVTDENREMVALTVLRMEKKGSIHALGHVLRFYGKIFISHSLNKDLEWCSYSRLFSCPAHSKCVNTPTRYSCLCDRGYFNNGEYCTRNVEILNNQLEGVLKYFKDGHWFAMCKERFGISEAKVACKQLGYTRRGAEAFVSRMDNLEIYTFDFNCSGMEAVLSDCIVIKPKEPCSQGFTAAVRCDTECSDDFQYGPNCNNPCNCDKNNSPWCDKHNGTCLCNAGWEGSTCTDDVDECNMTVNICKGDNEICRNTAGSFQCACVYHAFKNASGHCEDVNVVGPKSFNADGKRKLTLTCKHGSTNNVATINWSWPCDQTSSDTCTFIPQAPEDDGRRVNCTVKFVDGQIAYSYFEIDLKYPPTSQPVVHSNVTGDRVNITCSMQGGKPLPSLITISCGKGHIKKTPNTSHAYLDLKIAPGLNKAECICDVVWINVDWANKIVTFALSVNGTELEIIPALSVPHKSIIAIGTAGCGIALIIFFIVKRRRVINRRKLSWASDVYAEIEEISDEQGKITTDSSNRIQTKIMTLENGDGDYLHATETKEDYTEIQDDFSDDYDQGYSRPISDTLEKVDICRKDKFRREGERKDTLFASNDEDVQNQDYLHPVSVKPKSKLIWSEGKQDYLNPVQPEFNRSEGQQDYLNPIQPEFNRSEGEQDYLNPVQPEFNRSEGQQDYLKPVQPEFNRSEGEQDYLNPVQPEFNRSEGKQDYLKPVNLDLKSKINMSEGKEDYLNPVNLDLKSEINMSEGKEDYLNPVNLDLKSDLNRSEGKQDYLNPVNLDLKSKINMSEGKEDYLNPVNLDLKSDLNRSEGKDDYLNPVRFQLNSDLNRSDGKHDYLNPVNLERKSDLKRSDGKQDYSKPVNCDLKSRLDRSDLKQDYLNPVDIELKTTLTGQTGNMTM